MRFLYQSHFSDNSHKKKKSGGILIQCISENLTIQQEFLQALKMFYLAKYFGYFNARLTVFPPVLLVKVLWRNKINSRTYVCMCVCVCVCARVRAHARAYFPSPIYFAVHFYLLCWLLFLYLTAKYWYFSELIIFLFLKILFSFCQTTNELEENLHVITSQICNDS